MPSNKTAQAALAGNNLIIVLILVSFLAVGLTALIGKSLVQTIMLDQKILTAKDKADKKLAENLNNAPKLVKSYADLGALTRVVNDSLPVSKDVPSLLVTLENMSAQSGLRVKSVTPLSVLTSAPQSSASSTGAVSDDQVGVPLPKSFKVTVMFDGSYASLLKFLANVELSARPMKLANLQLSGSGSALSGQAEIQTYYQDKATLPIVMEGVK